VGYTVNPGLEFAGGLIAAFLDTHDDFDECFLKKVVRQIFVVDGIENVGVQLGFVPVQKDIKRFVIALRVH
jgi:hypothetical protein